MLYTRTLNDNWIKYGCLNNKTTHSGRSGHYDIRSWVDKRAEVIKVHMQSFIRTGAGTLFGVYYTATWSLQSKKYNDKFIFVRFCLIKATSRKLI